MNQNHQEVRAKLWGEQESVLEQLRSCGGDLAGQNPVEYSVAIQLQNRLDRIERALVRLEKDQYGFCCSCNRPISINRIRSIPEAELCLDCQSKLERRHNELNLYAFYQML